MERHELELGLLNDVSSRDTRDTKSLLESDIDLECDRLPHDNCSSLVSRLGKFHLAIILSTFVLCFGCLAFLTFIWVADLRNTVWLGIVLVGWTTRSVTISTLIIRWATAAQATTCTSILAAMLFVSGEVPLPAAAALSTMRFENTGPWSLLLSMRVEWRWRSSPVGLLAFFLSFTTLALQFSSSALLSQVGIASLPVRKTIPRTYYAADPAGQSFRSQDISLVSYIDTTPIEYPAFAEWISLGDVSNFSTPHGEVRPNTDRGIRDTGTVMRAFLPIRDAVERSVLTEYQGYGTVVDSRVVCMKPNLTDVVYSAGDGYRLTGLADIHTKPRAHLRRVDYINSSDTSYAFDCGFAAAGRYTDTQIWPITLCRGRYRGSKQGIFSAMDPMGQEEAGETYLLINATLKETITDFDDSDVWETLSLTSSDYTPTLHVTAQLTLCMAAFEAQDMKIHASRRLPVTHEPVLAWDTTTGAYNTTNVLRQLGTSSSLQERGIFQLAPRSWQWQDRPWSVLLTSGTFSTTSALMRIRDRMYTRMMNGAQYVVFAQMVTTTGNPAVALQAYFTTLCAIAYYDRIVMFDTAAPSTRVSLVQVTRPLGWTGYIMVTSVLVVHLILVMLVTLAFRRAGKLSRIGNAWSSVSQLFGPATADWIRDTGAVDDKTVKKWLKMEGRHGTLVQVQEIEDRVLIASKEKRS
ncbi:hypothetical protein EK21DRAFT_115674 [Setomelanomma holmii]|uniref:Uncharacterized protein n=1 Tax=Setomelanomma holmii TaxID=210430 RepID=A0A9P4H2U3_9PLEO|nr:hypothetical protein EK21DRAFT_115674 [Setomelanomma holmii]